MNISDYLNKKARDKEKKEEEFKKQRQICARCFRIKEGCFCDEIPSFSTKTSFRILMHPKEAKKERIGTGRLANICLQGSKIIVGEHFDDNEEVLRLIHSEEFFPMVLYPGDHSHNLSLSDFPQDIKSEFQEKKLLIFLIDGTWSCAKSMMRDSHNLHSLPRISFSPGVLSAFKIKQQPAPYCLSTIESLYYVLKELEKWNYENLEGKEEVLIKTLEKLVQYQLECAIKPNPNRYRPGSFKNVDKLNYSKKWKKRKIYFNDKS